MSFIGGYICTILVRKEIGNSVTKSSLSKYSRTGRVFVCPQLSIVILLFGLPSSIHVKSGFASLGCKFEINSQRQKKIK